MRQITNHALLFLLLVACNSSPNSNKSSPRSGIPDGPHLEYFKDSILQVKAAYKNGSPDGEYVVYFHDGKIDKQMFFRDGKKQGLVKVYYPNGQLKHQTIYKDGAVDGESTAYYPDGKTKIFTIVKDHTTKYSVKYDEKGNQVAFDREIRIKQCCKTIKLGNSLAVFIDVYTLPTESCEVYIYEKNVFGEDSKNYSLSALTGPVLLYKHNETDDKPQSEKIVAKKFDVTNGPANYIFKPTALGKYKLLALCVVIPDDTNIMTSSQHQLEFEVTE